MKGISVRRITWGLVALVAVLGCVNIHVYLYDEAKAKEAAEKIVRDIRASEEGAESPGSDEEKDKNDGAFLFLSSGIAYAEDIDISKANPQIQNLKEQIKKLDKTLEPYFTAGQIGESTRGEVLARVDVKTLDAKVRADLTKALKSVNDLRMKLYDEVIKAQNVQVDAENRDTTRRLFATEWVKWSKKGWWYQDPKTEKWVQKKEDPKETKPE